VSADKDPADLLEEAANQAITTCAADPTFPNMLHMMVSMYNYTVYAMMALSERISKLEQHQTNQHKNGKKDDHR